MFHTLAVFIVRRARWVLVAGLVALVGGVFLGMSAFDKLQTEGFDDPDSESSRAAALANETFGGGADYVLLVDAGEGRADEGPRTRRVASSRRPWAPTPASRTSCPSGTPSRPRCCRRTGPRHWSWPRPPRGRAGSTRPR